MQTQFNALTGSAYSGKNQEKLQEVVSLLGFECNLWVTFLQARAMGYQIKSGSHGTPILCYCDENEKRDDKKKKEMPNRVRHAYLFNLEAQCVKI